MAKGLDKTLVLFTKGFPYGASEPFLETECPLYKDYFERVLIVSPRKGKEEPTRSVPNGITVLPVGVDGLSAVKAAIAAFSSVDFWHELGSLVKNKGCSFKNLEILISTVGKGALLASAAKRWCDQNDVVEPDAVYAYWLNMPAYAATTFSSSFSNPPFCVSRAHRFDLYEDRARNHYPCLQKEIVSRLSAVYSISEDGRRDLSRRYPECTGKMRVSRLGAQDRGWLGPYKDRKVLKIVSCSRLVPVKRVHLIVDALKEMEGLEVEWTHIGGGPGFDELTESVKAFPANVTSHLTGTVPNSAIYDLYKANEFHVFVNVSASEGIPVSIMEAMSFGLPVIATDVGGVAELVWGDCNGWLLPADFSVGILASLFRKLYELDERAYCSMREASRKKFLDEYHGISNYQSFLDDLVRGQ